MIKIVKKAESSNLQANMLRIASCLIALCAAAVFIALLGYNPFVVYGEIIKGSTGTLHRFQETINKAIPLIILSLGISVSFKMKFSNIGAEGQFYMGALAAAFVVYKLPPMPMAVIIPLMILASMAFGALWCLFPAVLKLKFGTNETLVTLMMNYIAIKWISYLQYGPWKDPKAQGFPKMPKFYDAAVLPKVFGIHAGWIIALVLVLIIYVLMSKSKLGYEIAVMGENQQTAKYAGM
ncbi:MAG: ABC transporter permease, partial [Oscillospiraceae bacterium]